MERKSVAIEVQNEAYCKPKTLRF